MALLGKFRQIDWTSVFDCPLSQVLNKFTSLVSCRSPWTSAKNSKAKLYQCGSSGGRRQDVGFNGYREVSIKKVERSKRVSTSAVRNTAIYFLPILQRHDTSFSVSLQTCLTLAIPSCHSGRKNHSDAGSVTESCT